MTRLIDLTGRKFGKLTVLSHAGVNKSGHNVWNCKCDCGNDYVGVGNRMKYGDISSCGCSNPTKKTHGERHTRLYRIWSLMVDRCTNPNTPGYKNYGGRGITVCDRWRKYENFRDDMGSPLQHLSLDRIDNSKGYCKENCRWATRIEQANNKRNNILVPFEGKLVSLKRYCEEVGLKYKIVHQRYIRNNKTLAL